MPTALLSIKNSVILFVHAVVLACYIIRRRKNARGDPANGLAAMQHVQDRQADQASVHDVEAAVQDGLEVEVQEVEGAVHVQEGLEVGVQEVEQVAEQELQDDSEDDLTTADSSSLHVAEEESGCRPEHQNATSRMSTPLAIEEVGNWEGRTAGRGGSHPVAVALTRHTEGV